ncbi:hypothetical protein HPB50_004580 [Hyalomma asiaticum]|uniref:Uncharacterized protein n=1 Tax=Hyalomma asiaticum TaxID=266040 RepID=A0ACB7T4L8_HYAAI|nr:hypothetical protein HPB50_004580 [Hyalomma asiaticum]
MRRRGMLPADECLGATTFQEDEISVLIGSDIYWDVATGQITRVSPRILAAETLFGWTIQGTLHPLSPGSDARTTSLFIAVNEATANDADLDMRISNLWRIDALGLQDSPEDSQDDILAYEMFQRHVSKKEQRYEVHLLIRQPGLDDSQNNYALAKQRLLMQLRRFRESSDLLARYDDTIKANCNELVKQSPPS